MSIGPPSWAAASRHHAGTIVLVGQVGHDHRDLAAVGAQPISGELQGAGEVIVRLEGPGDDGHGGTLGREPFCDPGTDPSAGARDDGPSPCEPHRSIVRKAVDSINCWARLAGADVRTIAL